MRLELRDSTLIVQTVDGRKQRAEALDGELVYEDRGMFRLSVLLESGPLILNGGRLIMEIIYHDPDDSDFFIADEFIFDVQSIKSSGGHTLELQGVVCESSTTT